MDGVTILEKAIELGASDAILTAGEPPVYRVLGNLRTDTSGERLSPEDTRRILYSLLRQHQVVRFEKERELDFSVALPGDRRFRANAFLQRGAVGAAFRRIPEKVPRLSELELPPALARLALSQQGLLLVTGPTGSGKTTTLAALVEEINQVRRAHIVTIEDPIEYLHHNCRSIIEQREVGEDTLSFAAALRHVLRQDPDVILVGEMRDLEAISTALTAAETGHLVLGTLHTNDCAQSVDRIVDVFPAAQQGQVRSQLAASLLAIFSQRLIPRSDRRGLIPASELLVATMAARAHIREDRLHQLTSVIETGGREGMHTLDQSLRDLFQTGRIPLEEALRYCRNPRELQSLK
ncbi:MAG: type IV pilus twitching motility protein PilT [Planctomycetes bacterium]|jgi:twitching motility protein PilT|nr:type IV pilus twitching motility protein PilT [Planctomycetota bacterium]